MAPYHERLFCEMGERSSAKNLAGILLIPVGKPKYEILSPLWSRDLQADGQARLGQAAWD